MAQHQAFIDMAYPEAKGAGQLARMFVDGSTGMVLVPSGAATYTDAHFYTSVQSCKPAPTYQDFVLDNTQQDTAAFTYSGAHNVDHFTAGADFSCSPVGPTPRYQFTTTVIPSPLLGTGFSQGILHHCPTNHVMYARPTQMTSAFGDYGVQACWDISYHNTTAVANSLDIEVQPFFPLMTGEQVTVFLAMHVSGGGWTFSQATLMATSALVGGSPVAATLYWSAPVLAPTTVYDAFAVEIIPVTNTMAPKANVFSVSFSFPGNAGLLMTLPNRVNHMLATSIQGYGKMVGNGIRRIKNTSRQVWFKQGAAVINRGGFYTGGMLYGLVAYAKADWFGALNQVPHDTAGGNFDEGCWAWFLGQSAEDYDWHPVTGWGCPYPCFAYARVPTGALNILCTVQRVIEVQSNDPLSAGSQYCKISTGELEGTITLCRPWPRACSNDEHKGLAARVGSMVSDPENWWKLGKGIAGAGLKFLTPRISGALESLQKSLAGPTEKQQIVVKVDGGSTSSSSSKKKKKKTTKAGKATKG